VLAEAFPQVSTDQTGAFAAAAAAVESA
jgi:hypothetical protein